MKWAKSLIRIANHEVETLQKRLAEIVNRRADAELRMTMLHAEAEAERNDLASAEAGLYHIGFIQGWRWRRDRLDEQIAALGQEERGARDALSEAFETLKKYEQVLESAQVAERKEEARREAIVMDELGARKVAAR